MSEGADETAEASAGDAERLAELHAAFARGDYRTMREGARRLAASSADESVRSEARSLAERTEASGEMIAVYLGAAALVVGACAYWAIWAR